MEAKSAPARKPVKERLARNDTLRTIFVPLAILVSGLAIVATIWQGDREQRRQAESAFQLEAARIVMAEPTCVRAMAKAEQLRLLFPARLPPDFPDIIDTFLRSQHAKNTEGQPLSICDSALGPALTRKP